VEDWSENDHNNNRDNGDQQDNDREPYEVERIATVLAVTCMFLAALYTIFAILLFLYYGSEDNRGPDTEEDVIVGGGGVRGVGVGPSGVVSSKHSHHHSPALPSIANDPRTENFITMD